MADDLIILVPGAMGTALNRGDEFVWDTSISTGRGGLLGVLDSLRLSDETPLVPTHVLRGWYVWPGFWAGTGYGALLDRLAPRAVQEFPYDWRLSCRENAARLGRFVELRLGMWRERHGPDAKAVFVCHAMGGLVARYYLEVLGGREIAAALHTFGTPYSGSVRAVRALSGTLLPGFPRLSEALAETLRTFPSVAELLPSYPCVVRPSGEPVLLTGVDLPDLPGAAVRAGREFHDELGAAVALNGPPPYAHHTFGGAGQPTEQSVLLDGGRSTYLRRRNGVDHSGDGTVPSFSAVPPEWTGMESAVYRAVRHAYLVRETELLDLLDERIEGAPPGAGRGLAHELALDSPEVVRANEPCEVFVDAELDDLLLQARIEGPDGHVRDDRVPVLPIGAGRYRCILVLPPGTWSVRIGSPFSPDGVEDLIVAL